MKKEVETAGLSSVDKALLDDMVSSLPSDLVTEDEFKKTCRVSNTEYSIDDVMEWARTHWGAGE